MIIKKLVKSNKQSTNYQIIMWQTLLPSCWVLLLACTQIIDISYAFAPPSTTVGGSRGSHNYQQQQFVKTSPTIISNNGNIRPECSGPLLLQQLAGSSKPRRRAFVHNMILHGHSSSNTLEKSGSNHTSAGPQLNNSNYHYAAEKGDYNLLKEANNYNNNIDAGDNNNIGRNNINNSESFTNGEEEARDDMTSPYAVREYTHEHDVCILDDDDQNNDDDEMIEELFTSLLRKVGQYNPEAVVTSSSSVANSSSSSNQTIISQQKQRQQEGEGKEKPVSILRQAFNLAKSAHANQCRKSGELYITHPLGVAHILADKGIVDMTSLLTALLHDTVEDTDVTLHQIVELFGEEVGECVDGVTKIGKVKFMSYEEQQSENYRKLILAMSKDIRVILVKLADRLHNMRTLQYMPKEKQHRIARETMEIYAPLAHRLGIYKVKTELEDLCFRYLRPKKFMALESQINDAQVELSQYEEEVVIMLERLMKDSGVGVAPNSSLLVKGRTKGLWSIYNKMKRQGIDLEDIHDVIGFRIIVDDVSSCYQALGVVHEHFKPVPGRIKDLIALPKPNGYQSLHTTVIGPRGKRVEIQIRTKEMDEVAESGIAAHWIYKQGGGGGGGGKNSDSNQFAWLRQLVDDVRRQSDPKEFVKSVKEDLFAKEVFVFSPTGDIYPLAR